MVGVADFVKTDLEVMSMAPKVAERLTLCEERIGYVFTDKSLLHAALTHASGADQRINSNERLEFLGDAILGFLICETLFHRFPEYLEGELTKIKSNVVSRQTCAKVSEKLKLSDCLILGKGMASNPKIPPSLLADVFESLLAAIYLDGGDLAAREFISRHISNEIAEAADGNASDNYKSVLQQLSQRQFGSTPNYKLLDEKGPDHAKCFKIAVSVGGREFEPAWGRNKKEAEQRAAGNALFELDGEEPPFISEELGEDSL